MPNYTKPRVPCPSRKPVAPEYVKDPKLDPADLEFVLNDDHIPPSFLRAYIKVRDRCQLMFATDQQLDYLRRAKEWYIDGTFKLCMSSSIRAIAVHASMVSFVWMIMSSRCSSYHFTFNFNNLILLEHYHRKHYWSN